MENQSNAEVKEVSQEKVNVFDAPAPEPGPSSRRRQRAARVGAKRKPLQGMPRHLG